MEGRNGREEEQPRRRKSPGPHLFPFLTATRRIGSSPDPPQCLSWLREGADPIAAEPSPGPVGLVHATGALWGQASKPAHSSFPLRLHHSLIRRDAISVFKATHNHRPVLFHSISKQLLGVFYAVHEQGDPRIMAQCRGPTPTPLLEP